METSTDDLFDGDCAATVHREARKACEARDSALASVEANAGRSWNEGAAESFETYAREHETFTTEDARMHAEARGLPKPHDGRAWGAVAMRARKRGIMAPAGEWRPAKDPKVHAAPICVWRSRIYRSAAI